MVKEIEKNVSIAKVKTTEDIDSVIKPPL